MISMQTDRAGEISTKNPELEMHKNPIPFETLKRKTHFFFLRHGESQGNQRQIIQGHLDMPLTDRGKDQARSAGEFFSNKGLNHILSSPLSRATKTANLVAEASGIEAGNMEPSNALKEMDTGIFSGLTTEEIQTRYPEQWNDFQHNSWEAVPSAETVAALMERALSTWLRMIELANKGNEKILAVSHAGMIQWIFKLSFSDRWINWLPVTKTANCGIYHIIVTPIPRDRTATEPRNETATEPRDRTATEPRDETAKSPGDQTAKVPNDQTAKSPGYYAEWVKINHIPYS